MRRKSLAAALTRAVLFFMIASVGAFAPTSASAQQPEPAPSVLPAPPPPPPPLPPPPVIARNEPGNGLTFVIGRFATTLYGFVEFDSIYDSTQSFNDSAGNAGIARPDTYTGQHGRLTFGVRNSRIGLKITAPEYHEVRASALLEMDFLGFQAPPTASEATIFTSPTFRVRHMALKLENPYVDVLFGQYWQLFGWQPSFHVNTVEIQGIPGQVYSRSPQVRFSHMFKSEWVNFELAVAASRPPQRDSATPDGQGGARLLFNKWRGLRTGGATGSSIDPAGIGVSGTVRRFSLPEFLATPVNSVSTLGWGFSVDALVPVIPASEGKRGNSLTLTGSFVKGQGIADLFTGLTGGAGFPALPNPTMANPAPAYAPGIDNGLVSFDANGNLGAIAWQAFLVGAQYYFPGSGRVWLSGNFSQLSSNNIQNFGDPKKLWNSSRWFDGNLFVDVTPAVRLGAEYAQFTQTYVDGVQARNHRMQLSAFYLF